MQLAPSHFTTNRDAEELQPGSGFVTSDQSPRVTSTRSARRAAMAGPLAVLLFAGLSIATYLTGAPLFAGKGTVTMALSISFAVAALGVAVLLLGRAEASTGALLATVQGKFLASFAAVILLLTLVAAVACVEFTELRTSQRQLLERNFTAIVELARLRANLNAERLDFSLMFDLPQSAWGPWQRDHDQRSREDEVILRRLTRLLADQPESRQALARLISIRTEFERTCREKILPTLYGGKVAAAKALYLGPQTDRHLELRELTRSLEARETRSAQMIVARADERAGISLAILLGAGAASIAGAVAVGLFLHRAIGRYIDDRRRAEAALQRSAEFLQQTEEITHTGGWEYDIAARRLTWTDEVYRIHGIPTGSDLNNLQQAIAFYTGESNAKIQAAFREACERGQPYDLALQLTTAKGVRRWVRTIGRVETTDGKVLRVYGNIADITEQKQAEEKILSYAAELERSNQELERFAYVASHDLQEPLRTVGSFSQLMARRYRGRLDRDADEFIAFIVEGAERMQHLINDLLALSRVGTRGKPFTVVDTGAVFKAVTTALDAAVKESGAQITCDPLPRVVADEVQLGQLLQNLLGNAIKFRRPGLAPEIHVGASRLANGWGFSVRDNGIGIEPQYFDRIFIIFQRLHARGEYPGTGIGLAICKKIVERHGGQMRVESEPGGGSTFHFTIPDAPPAR